MRRIRTSSLRNALAERTGSEEPGRDRWGTARFRVAALPDLPEHYGRRDPAHSCDDPETNSAADLRSAVGNRGFRLDSSSGMEYQRRLHQRFQRQARRRFSSEQLGCDELQYAPARDDAAEPT